MNLNRKFLTIGAGLLLAAKVLAADGNALTNSPRDNVANTFLQIQEQIHATQLAIEQGQQDAVNAAKGNADALATRLQALELSVATQHGADAEAARQTQRLTLFLAGAFGLAGLGIMLLMVYFQWRAFTQLAELSAQQHAAIANANAVHQLAAPGRATVETSNARLLDVVSQLEKKIADLESGSRLLAAAPDVKTADLLADGQRFLDDDQPQKALEVLNHFLVAQPDHAEALAFKATALELLGRLNEALACCDHILAKNSSYKPVLLQKGGLLNKLNRHAEAIDCFEQALLAQDKKAKVS